MLIIGHNYPANLHNLLQYAFCLAGQLDQLCTHRNNPPRCGCLCDICLLYILWLTAPSFTGAQGGAQSSEPCVCGARPGLPQNASAPNLQPHQGGHQACRQDLHHRPQANHGGRLAGESPLSTEQGLAPDCSHCCQVFTQRA